MIKKNLKAFTLAEILITLGIIGIISAITLPTLVQNYKKQAIQVHIKKIYNTLYQAILRANSDHGEELSNVYKNSDFSTASINFARDISKYMPVRLVEIAYGGGMQKYGYSTRQGFAAWTNAGNSIIILNTGEILRLYPMGGRMGMTVYHIVVDLNGPKGPNQLGKDVFAMCVPVIPGSKATGQLIMVGELDSNGSTGIYDKTYTEQQIKENCETSGWYCGALIKRNNWKIPIDYPIRF